jgi:ketosteroid isomerase-like protein
MVDSDVMALLRRFGKAFNRGDVEGILDCVTEDFEWIMAEGPTPPDGCVVRGKAEMSEALARRAQQVPEIRFSETEVFAAAERVVGIFRAQGRYASGEALDVRGCDIYVIRDGKIAQKNSFWKHITAP